MERNVFIVWKGHRDYEENICVCETEQVAQQVLDNNDVEPRRVPGTIPTAPLHLMDADLVPWGYERVPFLPATYWRRES